MQIILARFGLATLNVAVFFIEEGWIIAMVAIFPFGIAIVGTVTLLSFFAVSCTNLCYASNLSPFVANWFERQKEQEDRPIVQWASKIAKGIIGLATLIVAIVVSPTTSALMLHQAGVERRAAYVVDVIYSVISGVIWCLIYGLGINLLKLAYLFVRNLIGG